MSTALKLWICAGVVLVCLVSWANGGAPIQAASTSWTSYSTYFAQPQPGQPQAEIGSGHFTLSLSPGQLKVVTIVVKNTGAHQVTLRDYLVDGLQSRSAFICPLTS